MVKDSDNLQGSLSLPKGPLAVCSGGTSKECRALSWVAATLTMKSQLLALEQCLCPVLVCLTLGKWLLYPQKICQLEPEGCMKVELVLRAAEALLATCQEGQKPEILAQLKDIKSQWEETVTYMTHCHR